jgi:hypothetical protein
MDIPLIKNILNEKNKNLIIGLITVFVILWSLIYAIPSVLGSLFNTILGNIILLLIVVLISINNVLYGLSAALLFFILYRVIISSSQIKIIPTKEGFTWKQNSISGFLKVQNLSNPDLNFDMNKIQEQSSQEEVDYFIKNGMWPWSPEVIELYKNSESKNKFVRTYIDDSVVQARKIYNQNVILYIISLQEKESQFLTKGVQIYQSKYDDRNGNGTYGYNSELINVENNKIASVIKCDTNRDKNKNTNTEIALKKYKNEKKTDIDYNNLENIIPGFKFISSKCNPCIALNDPVDYSCPFELNVKDVDKGVSPIWKYLWKTN